MLLTSKIKPKFKKRFYDTSDCNLVMFLQKSNKKEVLLSVNLKKKRTKFVFTQLLSYYLLPFFSKFFTEHITIAIHLNQLKD